MLVLETSQSRARYIQAKTLATMWYFTANLSYVMFIALIAFFTYKAEASMTWLPESELKKAVGQWAPWMTSGLAVAAAMTTRMVSKSDHDNKRKINLGELEGDESQGYEMALMEKELKDDNWYLHQYIVALFTYEWHEFTIWWQNPIEASRERPNYQKAKKEKKDEEPKDLLGTWDDIEFESRAANSLPRGIDIMPQARRVQGVEDYGFDCDFMEGEEFDKIRQKLIKAEGKKKTKLEGTAEEEAVKEL